MQEDVITASTEVSQTKKRHFTEVFFNKYKKEKNLKKPFLEEYHKICIMYYKILIKSVTSKFEKNLYLP